MTEPTIDGSTDRLGAGGTLDRSRPVLHRCRRGRGLTGDHGETPVDASRVTVDGAVVATVGAPGECGRAVADGFGHLATMHLCVDRPNLGTVVVAS